MPYKSEAQRKKLHAMAERGEIDEKIVREFDAESEGMTLPEKVKRRTPRSKARKQPRKI
jgi:hypothetical protein